MVSATGLPVLAICATRSPAGAGSVAGAAIRLPASGTGLTGAGFTGCTWSGATVRGAIALERGAGVFTPLTCGAITNGVLLLSAGGAGSLGRAGATGLVAATGA